MEDGKTYEQITREAMAGLGIPQDAIEAFIKFMRVEGSAGVSLDDHIEPGHEDMARKALEGGFFNSILKKASEGKSPFTDWEIIYAYLRVSSADRQVAESIANISTKETRHIGGDEEDEAFSKRFADWVHQDEDVAKVAISKVLNARGVVVKDLGNDKSVALIEKRDEAKRGRGQ